MTLPEPAGRVPPVPSIPRLAWLMFMQPFRLKRLMAAWGMPEVLSVWRLRGRLKDGDPVAQTLVLRLLVLIVLVAAATVPAIIPGLLGPHTTVAWMALPLAGLVVFALVLSVVYDSATGMALSVAVVADRYPLACGAGEAVLFLVAGGAAGLVLAVPPVNLAAGVRSPAGVFAYRILVFVVGVLFGLITGELFGPVAGVASGVAFVVVTGRVLDFALATVWLCGVSMVSNRRASFVASLLPHRHHDLLYVPLPGLRSLLVRLGEGDAALGERAIIEAADSLAQQRPARLALIELQARSLERAARERRWAAAASLRLPFLAGADGDTPATLRSFASAATDLAAASITGNHHHARQALDRAARALRDLRTEVAASPPASDAPGWGRLFLAVSLLWPWIPGIHRNARQAHDRAMQALRNHAEVASAPRAGDALGRRLLPVAQLWLDAIDDLRSELARRDAERPQIHDVFVAGPVLTVADLGLFKGRRDLIAVLDHDLASEQRAPLVLTGQRRMGKSSLLQILPPWLGTGTGVVSVDFQKLSGEQNRSRPDRLVAHAVASALLDRSPPPDAAGWAGTLEWLGGVDQKLRERDSRMLITVDEVERLQDGIDAGWASTDFLDFVRAAGNELTRLRFLLVSAYPLHRIGPAWPDRLVSALQRRVTYLDSVDAEELLRRPVEGFPDIYPDGGVDRIRDETRCHPFLLQYVASALCRRLNVAGRLRATDEDLQVAFDNTVMSAHVFHELWDKRTEEERQVLARLAAGAGPLASRAALQALASEDFVEQRDGQWRIAVPLFATSIADHTGEA